MKRSILFLVFCLLVWIPNAVADVGGKIGLAPGGFSFSVDDPDGEAERATALAPFSLAAVYDLNNKNRIFTSFTYLDFDLDAGTDNVGQSITGYQILCAYQHAVRLSYTLQFYIGGGLAYTSADFKDRYTVDDEGFLATAYDDRHEDCLCPGSQFVQRMGGPSLDRPGV